VTNVAATKRGPYARTRKRREEIAAAVLGIIDDDGYEAVTTARVAERSGISEPTVMYHFPTKDHLLVAALERSDELEAARAHVDEEDVTFDIESMRDAGAQIREYEPRVRLYYLLKGTAMDTEHPAAEYIRNRNARAVEVFARLVAQRQSEGLAHPGVDPHLAAIQIFSLYDGLTAMWISEPGFDLGEVLVSGIRRITGENWMEARARLDDLDLGL